MIMQCDYCKKEINKSLGKTRKYKHHFCSKECHGKWITKNGKVNKTCLVCNKEFVVNKAREKTAKFCSKKCHDEFQDHKIIKQCTNCGVNISIKPSKVQEHNFCSNKCVGEWNGQQRDHKIVKECVMCHKIYKVQQTRKDSITCSKKCQSKWFSEVFSKQPDYIEFRRQVSFKNIEKQRYKSTKPERIVENYLIEKNIEFIPQFLFFNKYTVDFYLPKGDVIIEVQGNYWHGNPDMFGEEKDKKPLTKRQKIQIGKDKGRFKDLELRGYTVYPVWESDIYNNIEEALYFLN